MKTETVHPSLGGFIDYIMTDPITAFGVPVMITIVITCVIADIAVRFFGKRGK